jgi:hypothetical protein
MDSSWSLYGTASTGENGCFGGCEGRKLPTMVPPPELSHLFAWKFNSCPGHRIEVKACTLARRKILFTHIDN